MSSHRLGRRGFLQAGAGAGTALAAQSSRSARRDNPVVRENSKPGTNQWQLQHTQFDDPVTLMSYPLNRRLRSSVIEGFVSKTSVLPGESIDIMASMKPPGACVIDFYRMGYYGGAGARHMARIGPFRVATQPMPMMTMERLRECQWERATSFTVPQEWPSGVYLGKLTKDEKFGPQSYVVFVVKEHRPSELLFQVSDLTWQAYNKWPGKDSLYDDGTPEVWYTGPHVRVSFDRPYAKYCQVVDAPLSAGSGSFVLWEHPLAFWLEQHGYDVTYCSNIDLHLDPGILRQPQALLSVGHDEYWSRKMLENAMEARDAGLSIAFLSGNAVSGEIIFYDSSTTGAPCRAFARRERFPDEQDLMGSTSYGPGYGDWVVTKPEHWIYEGTGLQAGDSIPGVIGWEHHGPPFGKVENLEVVAGSTLFPGRAPGGGPKEHAAVVYRGLKGNWVFNAGTIWWSEGLSAPPGHIPARTFSGPFGVNPAIQRITQNVLERMIRDSPRRA
ncbi:MAG TPA: N,N-dimethylformamidase beta subunit family domain-containing protein [Bryobacteraceae bacterium]|nr:N,N-dimethylformamidase beta subunit family domain-containing protein [Bryobacteraceae bacterium]